MVPARRCGECVKLRSKSAPEKKTSLRFVEDLKIDNAAFQVKTIKNINKK